MTQEAEQVVAGQKEENVKLKTSVVEIERSVVDCIAKTEQLEKRLQENIAGETEIEQQITQALQELKAYLEKQMDEKFSGMNERWLETEVLLRNRCAKLQLENKQ